MTVAGCVLLVGRWWCVDDSDNQRRAACDRRLSAEYRRRVRFSGPVIKRRQSIYPTRRGFIQTRRRFGIVIALNAVE